MNESPLEKYCATLEARAGDNKTVATLVAVIRVQRTALEEIRFRCDTDTRKANGSVLMHSRDAINAGDEMAINAIEQSGIESVTGSRAVWSHPNQPSGA